MSKPQNLRTNLFSEYYIHNDLRESEEWDKVSEDELQEAFINISDLLNRKMNKISRSTVSELEEHFIRPVLQELGIRFTTESHSNRSQGDPDYVFIDTEDAVNDVRERPKDSSGPYESVIAVADVERWDRPLDTSGDSENRYNHQNPSYRVLEHLHEVPARWGVLTNGKKWRLYAGPTNYLDSYYEVDLPALLEKGDLEDFKYFYLFFRYEAFLENDGERSFLDFVYNNPDVSVLKAGEEVQDGITETHLQLGNRYLICSMYENRYAVSWEAPVSLPIFLDIEAPSETEQQSVEAFFEGTSNQPPERKRGELNEICEDDRFPDRCGFFAVDYGGYEVTWEQEGTHTDDNELTVAVDGYDAQPINTTFLRSLDSEFSTYKMRQLLDRLSESINMDSPRNSSKSGESV